MGAVSRERNLILGSHAGPGAQEKGRDHTISAVVIIRIFEDIPVIWGISKWIIRAVGKEIGKMFFRKIPASKPLRKKAGLYIGKKAESPADTERVLKFDRGYKVLISGIIDFRKDGICGNVGRKITVDIVQGCHRLEVLQWRQLCLTFFLCHRTSENIVQIIVCRSGRIAGSKNSLLF